MFFDIEKAFPDVNNDEWYHWRGIQKIVSESTNNQIILNLQQCKKYFQMLPNYLYEIVASNSINSEVFLLKLKKYTIENRYVVDYVSKK